MHLINDFNKTSEQQTDESDAEQDLLFQNSSAEDGETEDGFQEHDAADKEDESSMSLISR